MFASGPATDLDIRATLIEQHSPPEILVHGLVTPDDVDKLFEMSVPNPYFHLNLTNHAWCHSFYERINVSLHRIILVCSLILAVALHLLTGPRIAHSRNDIRKMPFPIYCRYVY